jgi:tetratricopeptide (TPR) repeat protein
LEAAKYKIRKHPKPSGTIFLLFLCLTLLSCVPAPKAAQEPLSTYLTQAETLIAERRYGEAVKTLEEAAQVYPDTTLPLLKIGQIYLIQHRWLLAEDAFNRALARDLDNPVATAGLAEAVLNRGDLLRALDLWREATELNPDLPGGFTGLGRTHLFRFEFEAAKEAFLKQQAHQPDPEAQWHLAALEAPLNLSAANEYLLAIPHQASPDLLARRDYLLATLVPFTADSLPIQVAKATGIAMAQVQHWPLAAYALTIAKENFEDSLSSSNSLNSPNSIKTEQAETLSFLGHALAQAGRPALELFEQAQTLDPNSALPLFFYGIYLRRQGALNAGEALFNQAVALDPDNAAIQIELAQTNVLQGDFGAAETHYTLAATLAEDDLQIQVLRVRFYANRGYRTVEAGIPAVEDIIEADENNAEAHDLLGWMQFLSGEPGQAEKALRRALELDPDLVSARYHLARHLAAKGQSAAARAEYQRVIDWDTSGVFRERALKELQHLGQ